MYRWIHGALVAMVIVIWGVTFVSTRALLVDFSSFEILVLRFGLAFLVLCVVERVMRLSKCRRRCDEWLFAGVSLSSTTNEVAVSKQATTNSVSIKVVKTAKQPHPQCEAITLSGNRWKRRAAVGLRYCSQHAAIIRMRKEQK